MAGSEFRPRREYVYSGCVRSRAYGNARHCASLGLGEAASRSSRASRQGGAVVPSHGWTLVGGSDDVIPRACGGASESIRHLTGYMMGRIKRSQHGFEIIAACQTARQM